MRTVIALLSLLLLVPAGPSRASDRAAAPAAPTMALPRTRWDHRGEAAEWTQAALRALQGHGAALWRSLPEDVDTFCPAYPEAGRTDRQAFWVGLLSALARYESGHRPGAVGGGGQWHGLMQISPATARHYGCQATSAKALQDGTANLSCAVRILSVTLPRDKAIARRDSRWRGVAADWGPMRSDARRREMADWLRRQSYCIPLRAVRPRARPF